MRHYTAAFLLALGLAAPVLAEDAKPFTDASVIDLTQLLTPPPADDSAQTKAELETVLKVQAERTDATAARAKADDEEDVWVFADVIANPAFTAEKLPKFAAFFDRVVATEGEVVDPAKKTWARQRPYLVSDKVEPLLEKKKSGAYPSGHSTVGTLMAIVLSNMLPEKRAAIMARAAEYRQNRVVAGMHYPSDIVAGEISGTVIAARIMGQDDFKAEYEAAKTELRGALGM